MPTPIVGIAPRRQGACATAASAACVRLGAAAGRAGDGRAGRHRPSEGKGGRNRPVRNTPNLPPLPDDLLLAWCLADDAFVSITLPNALPRPSRPQSADDTLDTAPHVLTPGSTPPESSFNLPLVRWGGLDAGADLRDAGRLRVHASFPIHTDGPLTCDGGPSACVCYPAWIP